MAPGFNNTLTFFSEPGFPHTESQDIWLLKNFLNVMHFTLSIFQNMNLKNTLSIFKSYDRILIAFLFQTLHTNIIHFNKSDMGLLFQ